MGLEEYKRKRRFSETPEPEGTVKGTPGNSFVVQKHRASRLHYDFRLEMEGVLRSWAIPKGPTFNPNDKRLAVLTEDHPMDYGGFEGVIPAGHYGAGNVILWDRGTYDMVDPADAAQGFRKGKLHFVLRGEKLHGEWILVRGSREPNQWIFFKKRDEFAVEDGEITAERPESVVSGRLVEDVGKPDGQPTKKSGNPKTAATGTRHWHTPIERELERLGLKTRGRQPIPREVQPMLATLVPKPFDGDDWLFEIKHDGIRAIVMKDGDRIEMWSRNVKSLTNRFPNLRDQFLKLPADSVILDGEIVALDAQGRSRFHLLQPRIHLSRPADIREADTRVPAYFYAFDVMYINGFDLMRAPLIDRKAVLRKLLPDDQGWIRFTESIEGHGTAFYEAASRLGLEGIVAKLKSSPYQQARSKNWRKIKTELMDDFVIAGFTPPEGSRKHFGALVLGQYDRDGALVSTGRVGGGFDDRALAAAHRRLKPLVVARSPLTEIPAEARHATWVKPELVCEVRFNEWTPEGQLRAPVFMRFREDKEPAECRITRLLGADSDGAADPADPIDPIDPPAPVDPPKAAVPRTSAARRTPVSKRHAEIMALSSRIEFTNLDKVFWPEEGYTKGDLIQFYERISPYLCPHLEDRPLVLKRYPDGILGEYFYQKDVPDYVPAWLRTETLYSEDVDRYIRYFVGCERELLLYLANMGAITQNPWCSRIQSLDYPDYIIFDLDPVGAAFPIVQDVAVQLHAILDELGLRAYPKTSGASGIHVFLPILQDRFTYEDVRTFAEAIASVLVSRMPGVATIERVVKRRKPETVYIDFLQNVRGKTVASVYSPRAEPGAPVSTPLRWDELERTIEPRQFHVKNIFERLDRVGDLFGPVLTDRQDISAFLAALTRAEPAKRRK